MIITQVRFELDAPITLAEATRLFESTAPKYKGRAGLLKKYYVRSDDGLTVGGIYFWQSRDDADATYTDDWRRMVGEKYGAPPLITYFDTPVAVENCDLD